MLPVGLAGPVDVALLGPRKPFPGPMHYQEEVSMN
jgi:hypothetical protein